MLLRRGLVLLVAAATVKGEVTSSRLQIQIPTDLFQADGYEHQEALFGIPKYGGSIAERLVYPGVKFDEKGKVNRKPWNLCTDSDSADLETIQDPFILMVDRGDCTFAAKVRRAQHLGASGVIIADNKCLCSDTKCVSSETCEDVEPIMADDGSGADITIPSFLMKKPDAAAVQTHMEAGQYVQVEMTWSMPAPDDRVEWELWTSSVDPTATAFKRDFASIVDAMEQHAYFEPHYMLYNGSSYGCTDSTHCGNLCTNHGRYCMTDPDLDRDQGLSGEDVVKESLRQKCVWKFYGGDAAPKDQQGRGKAWWSYVNTFAAKCGSDRFTDASCISEVMSEAGVDESIVNRCISDSGGFEADKDNVVLDAELKAKSKKTIVIIPTVYVNNVVERGGINTAAVMTTICAGYASGTEPSVCNCAGQVSSAQVKLCVQNWDKPLGPTSVVQGVSVGAVIGIVIGVVTAMTAAGFWYYKRTQETMRDQVRGILAEYMPLDDMDHPGANSRVSLMQGNGEDDRI